MSLIVIGIVILVLVIFVTNTKRWKAIGKGIKKSRRDLEEEIEAAKSDRPPG